MSGVKYSCSIMRPRENSVKIIKNFTSKLILCAKIARSLRHQKFSFTNWKKKSHHSLRSCEQKKSSFHMLLMLCRWKFNFNSKILLKCEWETEESHRWHFVIPFYILEEKKISHKYAGNVHLRNKTQKFNLIWCLNVLCVHVRW